MPIEAAPDRGPTRWFAPLETLIRALLEPAPSARSLGGTLGAGYDPTGRGQQWQVDHPELDRVLNVAFITDPPSDVPRAVSILFQPERLPRLSEFENWLGEGRVLPGPASQPWSLAFPGPSNANVRISLFVTTNAVTGEESDPGVTELILRRDRRDRAAQEPGRIDT